MFDFEESTEMNWITWMCAIREVFIFYAILCWLSALTKCTWFIYILFGLVFDVQNLLCWTSTMWQIEYETIWYVIVIFITQDHNFESLCFVPVFSYIFSFARQWVWKVWFEVISHTVPLSLETTQTSSLLLRAFFLSRMNLTGVKIYKRKSSKETLKLILLVWSENSYALYAHFR